MIAIYKPRKRSSAVGYNQRRVSGLLQSEPASPFATPIKLNGNLDVTITTNQIKQLIAGGYIHSTIAGFNADFTKYTHEVHLQNLGKKYREKGKQDLYDALKNLSDAANAMTDEIWGTEVAPGMKPSTTKNGINTLDHLLRAQYVLTQSPSAIVSRDWIVAYEGWQKAEGEYTRKLIKKLGDDYNLRRTILVPAAKKVCAAANAMSDHLKQCNLKLDKEVLDKNANTSIQKQLNFINNFDPMTGNIGTMRKQLVAIASYFGTRDESLRSNDIISQINNPQDITENIQNKQFKLKRVRQDGLSDIVFELDTSVPAAQSTSISTTGISYKLRSFDNFTASATFTLPNDADEQLQYLFYLYRNILALTEFASDKVVGRTISNRRVLVSNRAKKNNVLITLGSIRQILIDFNVYITYRLLLTSFFGNRKDTGHDMSPLNMHFFEDLQQGYQTTHTAPPAFLVTARHVYKTADILKHYLNLDQRSKEWQNLNEFQQYFAGYHSYLELHKLWDQKKQILSAANQEDPDQNVYNLMIAHLDDLKLKDDKARLSVRKLSFYRSVTIKL